MTTSQVDTLATRIADRARRATDQMRELATGASIERPFAALPGSVDKAHGQVLAAFAAQPALSQEPLTDGTRSLLDASDAVDLRKAVTVLEAVRLTVTVFVGDEAARVVTDMRSDVVRLLEALR